MEQKIFLIIITILILVFCGFVIYFLNSFKKSFNQKLKEQSDERKNDQSFLMLQNQLKELEKTNLKIAESNSDLKTSNEKLKSDLSEKIHQKLSENQREMSDSVKTQFLESQKLIKNITEELGEVKKTSGQVVSFTEQLKNLQDILQNSKQRGALGEYFLETTIKNVLPPESYEFQYAFKDGTIVDAVIKLPDGIIPIDSKFSLENYNKIISENDPVKKTELEKKFKEDLKRRITETAKYIKKREKTMDFAFMFIPSEGIYYDLLVSKVGVVNSQNFLEYAFRDKKVIVVSPSTLYAYLQTVMQGLKSLKIEKQASMIVKKVEDLNKHLNSFEKNHTKLGNSISTVVNHYNTSSKNLTQISKDTTKIIGTGDVIEVLKIDKPNQKEEE
ncbi:DNA recombination protein RmuC [Candidatus Campbellbacteria bacterium]|nr:MAG: DNA recombination protein RmuC [Candidatus Campbellbacteria bacterium]